MKQQFFSFFCAEKSNNLSEIIIVIDNGFKDMQEIYDYIGKCVYGDFPKKIQYIPILTTLAPIHQLFLIV